MKQTMNILLTIVAIYLFLQLLLFLVQGQMLFLPDGTISRTPEIYGLQWENAQLQTADGITLHGWYVPHKESDQVLLFSHGNAGNISYRLELLEMFHRHGFSTFIYDYRGYGKSGGRPGEKGLYRDVEAAWHYLVDEQGYRPEQIILYGRSLGGAVSAHLAKQVKPAALILDSAFTGARQVATEIFPFVPGWLVRFRFNTIDYLREVSAPVLVMHSPDDEIIGFHHGEELYAAASNPRKLVRLQGGHNDNVFITGDRYFEEIRDFLQSVAARDF